MPDLIRYTAKHVVTVGRIIAAAWRIVCALGLAALTLWLFTHFDSWLAWGFGILAALDCGFLLVAACEAYLSAVPEKHPEAIDRALRSRSMYVAADHQRARQEKRRLQQ